MIDYHVDENNWSYPILDRIDILAQNIPEISKLMAIAKKGSYLTGKTELMTRLMNAADLKEELYKMYKTIGFQWMELANLERTDSGLPGNITISYLEGIRDNVNRLMNTNSLESELSKIEEEIPIEWRLINDALIGLIEN